MSDLKPCPFCGGSDVELFWRLPLSPRIWRVRCASCQLVTPGYYETSDGKAEAIKFWNQRAPEPQIELITLHGGGDFDKSGAWDPIVPGQYEILIKPKTIAAIECRTRGCVAASHMLTTVWLDPRQNSVTPCFSVLETAKEIEALIATAGTEVPAPPGDGEELPFCGRSLTDTGQITCKRERGHLGECWASR